MEDKRETTERWEPCEHFSPDECKEYVMRFRNLVIRQLVDSPIPLGYSQLLDMIKFDVSRRDLIRLWDPRNLPMTRDFLDRALYALEDRATEPKEKRHARVHFDGQKYSMTR